MTVNFMKLLKIFWIFIGYKNSNFVILVFNLLSNENRYSKKTGIYAPETL